MTHDPLCEWSTPCTPGENQQHSRDTENLAVPDATYCWMCGADCLCDLIAKVREHMLAKCISAVERFDDCNEILHILDALRALQKVDTPEAEVIEHINLQSDNIVVRILLVAFSVIPLVISSLWTDVVLRVRRK